MIKTSAFTTRLLVIFRAIFSIGALVGVSMLVVPIVDFIYNEPISFSFLISGAILISIGYFLYRLKLPPPTLFEVAIIASTLWIILPFISTINLLIETDCAFIDAFFESISGFTTAGFTVFELSKMKHSILLWRSIMEWLGGVGFVIFAILIFPRFYTIARELYSLEVTKASPTLERILKFETTFYKTAIRILTIYGSLTFLAAIFYIAAGMTVFEAVNHALTTISTGGMSTYNQGFSSVLLYAPLAYIPAIAFMIIGGMNFANLNELITGKFKKILRSEELFLYITLLLFFLLLISLSSFFIENNNALLPPIFNAISALSTTGYHLGSISEFKDTTKVLLIIMMFIGGMSFSTAGGIKIFRILLILKKIKQYAQSIVLPPSVIKPIRIGGITISDAEVSQAFLLIILHIFTITIGAMIISMHGYSFIDSLFEATSVSSIIGLSTGIVSITSPMGIKILAIVLMLLGRLEYLQIFLILSVLFRKRIVKRR